MTRECHVRFCEGGGVRFPSATRLLVHCRSERQAQAVLGAIRGRFAQWGLEVHPTKTRIVYWRGSSTPWCVAG
jgi:hypothetical protein